MDTLFFTFFTFFKLRTLHLRSEVMEHNINLGLDVLKYLENGCGMSPRRAR